MASSTAVLVHSGSGGAAAPWRGDATARVKRCQRSNIFTSAMPDDPGETGHAITSAASGWRGQEPATRDVAAASRARRKEAATRAAVGSSPRGMT